MLLMLFIVPDFKIDVASEPFMKIDVASEPPFFCLFAFFLREILNGIAVTDENGNKLGHSTVSSLEPHSLQNIFLYFLFF